jgi:hypothetical protein
MHRHIAHKRPPLGEIISMMEKHGFIIRNLEHNRFDYKFTNGTAMLNHYFIRLTNARASLTKVFLILGQLRQPHPVLDTLIPLFSCCNCLVFKIFS